MHALIAEDSRTQAFQLKALLEENGFEVTIAADGEEALASARARRPDVVISDIMMPNRDGYELCRALKEDSAMSSVPVILVTSLGEPLDVVRALAAGADNFVSKPYDEAQLLRRLRRATTRGTSSNDVSVGGETFEITSDRSKVLEVLVSALEDARVRNAELEASRAALTEAKSRRDEVLHVVSHELRGPLGVLVMAADVFARDAKVGAPPEKQRTFSERVVRQAQRMLTIVDDLLDVTRIDAGELRVEPTPADLVEVVRDAIDRIRPSLGRHTIELDAPQPVRTMVDVDRIEQVIANFLTNAIKYSPAGGRITVKVQLIAIDKVKVSVSDQGIGIDAESLPRIFERYFRAPGSHKAAKGIGLGLFVTKRLVEAHDGTVHVESTQASEGRTGSTTFSFVLPVRS